jgi:prepilin-type processing-associated H-X9-DG protein
MPIFFTCPHCGKATDVAEQYAGQSVACGNCGKSVTVAGEIDLDTEPRRRTSGCLKATWLLICVGLGAVAFQLVFILTPLMFDAGARRMTCTNNVKWIALAMHNYHAEYGCLPPAYIPDKSGKPMHSWRVLILPFVGEEDLYKEYRFDEPWDGLHNKLLANRMPKTYQCPLDGKVGTTTCYAMLVGPPAVSSGSKSCSLKGIKDGASNTFMVVEAVNAGINWMEPRDLDAEKMTYQVFCGEDVAKGKNDISSRHNGAANVVLCDGSVRSIAVDTDPKVVKAMTTIDGGEAVHLDDYLKQREKEAADKHR